MNNVFFDTCVYHQPGIDLLFKVIRRDNILFASEMVGAVRGIDPGDGPLLRRHQALHRSAGPRGCGKEEDLRGQCAPRVSAVGCDSRQEEVALGRLSGACADVTESSEESAVGPAAPIPCRLLGGCGWRRWRDLPAASYRYGTIGTMSQRSRMPPLRLHRSVRHAERSGRLVRGATRTGCCQISLRSSRFLRDSPSLMRAVTTAPMVVVNSAAASQSCLMPR